MSDLIRRDDAIEAIKKCSEPYVEFMLNDYYMAVQAVERVPSAQPEVAKDTNVPCKDLISRQAAIRWVKTECNPYGKPTLDFESGKWVIKHLEQMPSAQPDIIRCNACKHWTQTTGNMPGFGLGDCDYLNAKFVNCNGYCYWAERRQDG